MLRITDRISSCKEASNTYFSLCSARYCFDNGVRIVVCLCLSVQQFWFIKIGLALNRVNRHNGCTHLNWTHVAARRRGKKGCSGNGRIAFQSPWSTCDRRCCQFMQCKFSRLWMLFSRVTACIMPQSKAAPVTDVGASITSHGISLGELSHVSRYIQFQAPKWCFIFSHDRSDQRFHSTHNGGKLCALSE